MRAGDLIRGLRQGDLDGPGQIGRDTRRRPLGSNWDR
jgi:hypothetical protein